LQAFAARDFRSAAASASGVAKADFEHATGLELKARAWLAARPLAGEALQPSALGSPLRAHARAAPARRSWRPPPRATTSSSRT
jgi:hypothetical protein